MKLSANAALLVVLAAGCGDDLQNPSQPDGPDVPPPDPVTITIRTAVPAAMSMTRAPGTMSFIRFSERRKVDLPQPEGPMSAVTWFARILRLIS